MKLRLKIKAMYINTINKMVSRTAHLYYGASPMGEVVIETKHETRKEALKAKRELVKKYNINTYNMANFEAMIELSTNY